jgi:hypothetical protein
MAVPKRNIPVGDLHHDDVIVEGKDRFTILNITPVIRRCAGIHVEMRNARTGAKSTGCYALCGSLDIQDWSQPTDAEAAMGAEAVEDIITAAVSTAVSQVLGVAMVANALGIPVEVAQSELPGMWEAADFTDTSKCRHQNPPAECTFCRVERTGL